MRVTPSRFPFCAAYVWAFFNSNNLKITVERLAKGIMKVLESPTMTYAEMIPVVEVYAAAYRQKPEGQPETNHVLDKYFDHLLGELKERAAEGQPKGMQQVDERWFRENLERIQQACRCVYPEAASVLDKIRVEHTFIYSDDYTAVSEVINDEVGDVTSNLKLLSKNVEVVDLEMFQGRKQLVLKVKAMMANFLNPSFFHAVKQREDNKREIYTITAGEFHDNLLLKPIKKGKVGISRKAITKLMEKEFERRYPETFHSKPFRNKYVLKDYNPSFFWVLSSVAILLHEYIHLNAWVDHQRIKVVGNIVEKFLDKPTTYDGKRRGHLSEQTLQLIYQDKRLRELFNSKEIAEDKLKPSDLGLPEKHQFPLIDEKLLKKFELCF